MKKHSEAIEGVEAGPVLVYGTANGADILASAIKPIRAVGIITYPVELQVGDGAAPHPGTVVDRLGIYAAIGSEEFFS